MSGGMRQRVMIAMALLCQPKLLIADEPTTALDVTIQAQILRILKKLAEESDTSVILITHDMGVVAEMADHDMVMYAGKSVEYGTAEDIFDHPMHPYTVGLLKSIPKLGSGQEDHLFTIEGTVRDWMRCRPAADFLRDVHMQRNSAKKKIRECREKQDILYDASGLWIPKYRTAGRWNNGDPFIGNPGCKKIFSGKKGTWKEITVKAVDSINLKINQGEIVGLVGESGCGKSTLGKSILKLHEITGGRSCSMEKILQIITNARCVR